MYLHCIQNSASYLLYSGRYDPSTLGFHPLPEFIPKQDTWENCYSLGYRGPNRILEYVPQRVQNLISVVQISDPEYEIVTHGMLYNFIVLNSPVIGHIGRRIINPNWWNKFWWNIFCWIRDIWGYLSEKFQTQRISNFRDITETVTGIFAEEIGKLGLPVLGASLHCF